jgi:hypothetical protein
MKPVIRNPSVPLSAIFCTFVGFFAPIYMLFFAFLIKWDKEKTYADNSTGADDVYDPSFIIRGDLPEVLRWAQTIDCRFPGGVYEKRVKKQLGNNPGFWRRYWTSYMWAGHSNRAHGLASKFSIDAVADTTDPFDPVVDHSNWEVHEKVLKNWVYEKSWEFTNKNDGVWQTRRPFFGGQLIYGYSIYQVHGKLVALPVFTWKRK